MNTLRPVKQQTIKHGKDAQRTCYIPFFAHTLAGFYVLRTTVSQIGVEGPGVFVFGEKPVQVSMYGRPEEKPFCLEVTPHTPEENPFCL